MMTGEEFRTALSLKIKMIMIAKIMEDTGINHYLKEFLIEKGLYEEYKEYLVKKKTEDIKEIHGRITDEERKYLKEHGDEISEDLMKMMNGGK